MTRARKTQISLEATPYYHCVSRCVRRAFLCGRDERTGQDFGHRRQWIETRLLELSQVFALDVCAYAVMSNHYHVVLHINVDKARSWSMDAVIDHWHSLFNGNLLSHRFKRNDPLSDAEMVALEQCVSDWRDRLMSISWFMRVLNEGIARQANAEDRCTGRFWEGRYKSQALLDEKALAACLAYVDLNPIRAKMADRPETSDHTSAQKRIQSAEASVDRSIPEQPKALFPFVGYPRQDMPEGLPFRLQDYFELLDWTGRQFRQGKRGAIDDAMPPLLKRLNIEPEQWLYTTKHFESTFKGLVGSVHILVATCRKLGYKRTLGLSTVHLLS